MILTLRAFNSRPINFNSFCFYQIIIKVELSVITYCHYFCDGFSPGVPAISSSKNPTWSNTKRIFKKKRVPSRCIQNSWNQKYEQLHLFIRTALKRKVQFTWTAKIRTVVIIKQIIALSMGALRYCRHPSVLIELVTMVGSSDQIWTDCVCCIGSWRHCMGKSTLQQLHGSTSRLFVSDSLFSLQKYHSILIKQRIS